MSGNCQTAATGHDITAMHLTTAELPTQHLLSDWQDTCEVDAVLFLREIERRARRAALGPEPFAD